MTKTKNYGKNIKITNQHSSLQMNKQTKNESTDNQLNNDPRK